MDAPALRAEGLGKRYRVGELHRHTTLREAVVDRVARPFRRAGAALAGWKGAGRRPPSTFWALRDVTFEVRPGEVLGVIGPNGAGKTTLLKILSRITEPTTGRAEGRGRVGSLLEVGTGFHPELTGRENIYLNGAILGMRRQEIDRKFDEIVAFSGVEPFLETPVKRFSSGMYVRLAFAVAAHLETEILLVDEVLAVGDAQFRKKCLGKMDRVAREGRTVVFVSHNMGLVQTLCTRGILLREGRIAVDGSVSAAVSEYLTGLESRIPADLLERSDRSGAGNVRLAGVEVTMGSGSPEGVLSTGHPARFAFRVTKPLPGLECSFTIYDQLGQGVSHLTTTARSDRDLLEPEASDRFVCQVDELPLLPGRYRINVALSRADEVEDHLEGAAAFSVEPGAFDQRPVQGASSGYGSVLIRHRWILYGTP